MLHINPPSEFAPEQVSAALLDAFAPDGLAGQLGHEGFAGKKVVDVGAGDGRYTRVLSELGASEITSVEKHQCFIDDGMRKGWFTGRVVCADVVSLATVTGHQFDQATIMNISPQSAVEIIAATVSLIQPDGQLIVTLVEKWRTGEIDTFMRRHFPFVNAAKVWKGRRAQPAHNVMVVGSRKSVA